MNNIDPRASILALADVAQRVKIAEKRVAECTDSLRDAQERLEYQQEKFDEARDAAVHAFPALLTGFKSNETVVLKDGRVTVVEED